MGEAAAEAEYAVPAVPFGNAASVMAEQAITTVYVVEPLHPPAAALIVKVNDPLTLGVPVIAPVEGLSVKPPGNAPLDTLKV